MASQYFYERGLRKIARTPASVAATPSNEELTLRYVAAKAGEEERARGVAGSLDLRERRLDEQARQHGQEIALARDTLSAAGKQDRRATWLSLANLGLEGASGHVKLKEMEKQQKMYEDLMEERRALIKSQQDSFNVLKALIQQRSDIWQGTYEG